MLGELLKKTAKKLNNENIRLLEKDIDDVSSIIRKKSLPKMHKILDNCPSRESGNPVLEKVLWITSLRSVMIEARFLVNDIII
jgi:hypothetical protein